MILLRTLLILSLAAMGALIYGLGQTPDATAQTPTQPGPLTREGATATLRGPIGFDSYQALLKALERDSALTTLVLDSPGGRVPAARGLARLVREGAIRTEVYGTCASACTLVFLAGETRVLHAGARLGFHGYRLISGPPLLDPEEEQARDTAYMIARGVAPAFAARAYATPHSNMWFPTRQDLTAAGVLAD